MFELLRDLREAFRQTIIYGNLPRQDKDLQGLTVAIGMDYEMRNGTHLA